MTPLPADMSRLELILRELREAIVASDGEGRILLFNPAAKKLFHDSGELALGHSLYEVCGRAPIEYTIRLLLQRQALRKSLPESHQSRFICTTLRDARFLLCNMSLISTPKNQPSFFILTFEDATRKLIDAGRENRLVERIIAGLRGPLANLHAAAENLRSHPEMDEEMRHAFEQVMIRESEVVMRNFAEYEDEARSLPATQWPLSDVYSADLLRCVVRGLPEDSRLRVTLTGVPLWMQADTYPLTLALLHLLGKLEETLSVTEVDMEVLLGDRRVYIDIVWQGEPVAPGTVTPWLQTPLSDPVLHLTLGEVLERHDSDIWSQSHRRQGYALLRIPVPISPRQWEEPAAREREQPIFYDFSLLDRTVELGDLSDRPLSSLAYVVFDTETTGLSPEAGDEILAISAVRILDGRILSEEKFACMIRPQRPLSPELRAIFGISDQSLRDKPGIREALRQFKSFAGDAVLVSHNAAFDMQFIQSQQELADLKFDNPLLDTLLLFSIVAPDATDRTLAGIGKKLGIETGGRITAMGDAFTTAQIFLELLELLDKKGIATLGGAMAASEGVLRGGEGMGE